MFEGRQNMVLYVVATVLLYIGVWQQTNLTLWVALTLFLAWDVLYSFDEDAFAGRDVTNLLSQVNTARLHMSYFLPFYGVLLGILFTLDAENRQRFYALLGTAGISTDLLMAPLVVASLGILFIPIRLVRRAEGFSTFDPEPSRSLKALLGAAAFFQQASIFMFLHVVLRILDAADVPGVILVE